MVGSFSTMYAMKYFNDVGKCSILWKQKNKEMKLIIFFFVHQSIPGRKKYYLYFLSFNFVSKIIKHVLSNIEKFNLLFFETVRNIMSM
jgi:hypothetical protein